ncbi:hypothetical protein [Salinibaculum rarum]|uniref:hypothetical protein n=1 Tax=Salinibaculum rarum TaxID=3058903 RepID=UPI00265EC31A|nr:hypothetical protein [Salinibaculum sp. KK48]
MSESEKRTIEVSADVFETLAQDKGKRTWDQQLQRMHEMAYGTDYVRTPKLQDFSNGGPGGVLGTVRVPADGDLEFVLRLPNGTPTAVVTFDKLAPNEEVTVEVPEGDIVEV